VSGSDEGRCRWGVGGHSTSEGLSRRNGDGDEVLSTAADGTLTGGCSGMDSIHRQIIQQVQFPQATLHLTFR
jgi:hypothetical protein